MCVCVCVSVCMRRVPLDPVRDAALAEEIQWRGSAMAAEQVGWIISA